MTAHTVRLTEVEVHARTLSVVAAARAHDSSRSHSASAERGSSRASAESGSRAERKERTRRKLLDVTLHLITDRSLASLSLREVAREAGIVPTAFYRHYASLDALGVDLVDECMRPLRQMIRDVRRGPASTGDIIKDTVVVLGRQVRAHPEQFRFLSRERYGGVASVRRAIATELRLFTSELTVDLARLAAGFDWSSDDLEMVASLMVASMMAAVLELLELDERHPEDEDEVLDLAERQLRLIVLGMGAWSSKP